MTRICNILVATLAVALLAPADALAQQVPLPKTASDVPVPVPGLAVDPVPVTVKSFARAESDSYFRNIVKLGGFGTFYHYRTPTPIDQQTIVRMNRDTLYSGLVIDLDAGPVTITLPDVGKRFMSMLVISEDHYTPLTAYAPATVTLTKEQCGTRYILAAIRTLIDANDPADVKLANALQDQIKVVQAGAGKFEVPDWDPVSKGKIQEHLYALQSMAGVTTERRMGKPGEVDPIFHLLATAASWGLNPPEDAIYKTVYPKANDGKTVHTLTVKDVPVDGFWSITIYDSKGYMFESPQKAYAINNFTAKPNADGSFTIQFGGDPKGAPNYLAITPGWSYSARCYRPRKEVIDGTWNFPEATPVSK